MARMIAFQGLRHLRRTPAYAVGVVLSLGFGIGVCAIVYSWMVGMVLEPLPAVRDLDELVSVTADERSGVRISVEEYREWQREGRSLVDMAAGAPSMFAVELEASTVEQRSVLHGLFVSPNYFDVLGVRPGAGRLLGAADDVEGGVPVAVVSDLAWRLHFDGAPDVVGRMVRMNGRDVRIAGVAPPRFHGHIGMARFDLWVPLSARPALVPSDRETWNLRESRWLDAFGRLMPGVDVARADQGLRAISERQALEFRESRGRSARVLPFDTGSAQTVAPLLVGLVTVTLLILLLICSNVANLVVTRVVARRREVAVRLSLGAPRSQVVGHILTEVSVLALAGACIGVAAGSFSDDILRTLIPPTPVPLIVWSSLDLPFIAFVVAITVVCVLGSASAPALVAARAPLAEPLRVASGTSKGVGHLRTALVVAQFGIAVSVLVATALFLKRAGDLAALDLGFQNDDRIVLMSADMTLAGHSDRSRWREVVELATERVATTGGVRAVAIGSFVPLGMIGYTRQAIDIPGRPDVADQSERVLVNGVGPRYFETMGIPLTEGRAIEAADGPGSSAVVVVNQAFADRYLDGSGLGHAFTLGDRSVSIVGVARNGRYDFRDVDNSELPLVYFAWSQAPTSFVTIHVRTDQDPLALMSTLQASAREVEPGLLAIPAQTLRDYTSVAFAVEDSGLRVLSFLSGAALLLASIGLSSVISYLMSLRRREMGIRMALGATPLSVAMLVIRHAIRIVGIGSTVGLAAAWVLSWLLRSRVPGLPAPEIVQVVWPLTVLAACALAAVLLPARRAAALDPALTLQAE
jgi:predicted permease